MNSAFRDIVVLKDYTLIKSVTVALLTSMAGFAIMVLTNTITINPKPILWAGNLVGSFIFGIGMVIAGGCASGITYRVGEGMVGAMTAVLGLMITATLTASGFLAPVKNWLQQWKYPTEGASATVASLFGVDYPYMALGIVVVAVILWVILARRNKEEAAPKQGSLLNRIFKQGWGWLPTGIAIGLVGIAAFPLSAASGRNYPLGITSGWVKITQLVLPSVPTENSLKWDMWLIVGIVVGAAVAALIAKEFKFRVPKWTVLIQTFFGGALMGFGAVCSTGCNIGHVLSGIPQLSIGSLLAGLAIVLGSWLTAYLMFVRPMASGD
ncbi:MAG TPA: YeeE/YedE family protein [Anaerolineae bacterium]|nr:YeeE/YedE family protein [Anaerolineae bacterium]